MDFIDTHAHLYAEEFDQDRTEMIQRGLEAGVRRFYLPNVDMESVPRLLATEQQFPDACFAMMGLHPCSVGKDYPEQLAQMEKLLESRPFAAIGEIGLDYYWSKEFVEEQKQAFRTQAAWAKKYNYAIILHARDALDELIGLVKEAKKDNPMLKGVFHCFSGSYEQAQAIIKLGFYLGIGGVLTFKNNGMAKFIHQIPLEYLVLETDAPYLSPVPYRGKRNEPAYIPLVADFLCNAYQLPLADLKAQIYQNSLNLFAKAAPF
jgi:TatD DNase family protein